MPLAFAETEESTWRDAKWRNRVRRRLTRWFDQNARDLPWRRDPTPYNIWISEIMLQQTQVATVIPYFERFLKRFPTLHHLADAPEKELLSMWEGLGYYRRARFLQKAAKVMVESHGGEFPHDIESIAALPGVGRYTCGAIASISLDKRAPIVEGNTVRVYARWIGMQTSPRETEANGRLWEVAEAMLPARGGSGRFNQAAMELGALVCRPKEPSCEACPVKDDCVAYRHGFTDSIPGKVTKTIYEDRTEYAFVIRDSKNRFLVGQRDLNDRWAGMWDLPRPLEHEFTTAQAALDAISDTVGIPFEVGPRIQTIKHGVTKYKISLHVHDARKTKGTSKKPRQPFQFVDAESIQKLPMPVTARQIIDGVSKNRQGKLPI